MAVNNEEVKQKAKRIIKILKQIAENLSRDEIITLRSNIKEAIEIAQTPKDQREENVVKKALGPHVQMLEFRAGISVNLIKQSVRAFIMITENEHLGKTVYGMFTDYMVEEHPTLIIGIDLDDDLLRVYFKALDEGSELARHIRLMVVGMYGVGKTTLVNRLLEKETDEDPDSTVGIDISVNACEVDAERNWKMTEFEEKDKMYKLRLQELLQKNKQRENTTQNEGDVQQVTHVKKIFQETGIKNTSHTERHEIYEDTATQMERDKTETTRAEKIMKVREGLEMKHPEATQLCEDVKSAGDIFGKENKTVTKPTTVSIWDFAGQSVYYSTHHFFLNPRAIYLLVLDLSKSLHEKVDEGMESKGRENLNLGNSRTEHTAGTHTYFTQLDAFRFWLKSIYIYTRQKGSTEQPLDAEYKPTIVLIGTHKDKCKENDKDRHARDYFDEALGSFDPEDPILDLIYEKRFFVSKHESSNVFASLRSNIYEIAKDQPFYKEEVPAKFIPLERLIEKKKHEKAETMLFEELVEVNQSSHYALSLNEIRLFLRFQHAFGNVLYYEKANPDTVILRPQWIIDAFKLFVTHKRIDKSTEWTEFIRFGKLSENLLNNLLGTDNKWSPFRDKIVNYLEHLDIIAKPAIQETSENVSSRSSTTDKWVVSIPTKRSEDRADFYFMPCMLPTRRSSSKIRNMLEGNGKSSPILCMLIKKPLLPPSVFHRILANCIKEMEVFEHMRKYILYSSLGAFHIDKTTILTIWTWENMIYLKITSYHSDNATLVPKADLVQIRTYFERLVRRLFETAGTAYTEVLEMSFYVTCPRCPEQFPFDGKVDDEGFPIDQKCRLLKIELNDPMPAQDDLCSQAHHHIRGEDVLAHWFLDKPLSGTEYVDDLFLKVYDERTLENIFADLAEIIDPEKIYDLATALEIQDIPLKRIKSDYGKPVLNYIFHLLYKGSKSGQSLRGIQKAAEKASVKEEVFLQILKRDDSDEIKRQIDEAKTKWNPEQLKNIESTLGPKIAQCVGDEYWLLGIRLDIGENKLQRRFLNRSSCEEKDIIEILVSWWKDCGEKTNEEALHQLVRALVKCNSSMRELLGLLEKP